ncbi:hypothetical protein FCL40_10980 [Ferrimonas sediminicola]|uniref:Porin n=1 Tax=Ferrimonas sediminicola TaxID=2569538 RepID=A0A4U1BCD6_9GAMM|nr:hypothetical protein [Ferrimonas sediminicola]TKB48673.1 hypothetical protein FCL40_10980 [Ferrimonas sediminicola]
MRAATFFMTLFLPGVALGAVDLWDQHLSLSGFASVSATRSDNGVPLYFNRRIEDEWCFDCDTTVGLQLDSRFSERWRASVQLVKRPQDSFFNPQFEWGYLSWEGDALEARVGRLRIPLFLASDYYFVGSAYPWARPPVDLYDTLLGITAFNGADLLYQLSLDDELELTLHPFYGGHNHEDVDVGPLVLEVETDILAGLNLRFNGPAFTLNVSYLYADYTVNGIVDALDIFALGLHYEWRRWELWSEFETDQLQNAAYLGLVWNLGRWRPYLMVARNWKRIESASYLGGVRYDLLPNLSVNLEYQLADALEDSEGQFVVPPRPLAEPTQAKLVTLMLSYHF